MNRRTVVVGAAAALAALAVHTPQGKRADYFADRPRPRVLILMFSTPNVLDYAQYSERVNRAYAERHGYDFKHHVGESLHATPAWTKVKLMRDALDTHDVVFWIDSDAVFNKLDTPLDAFIASSADFMGCTDSPNGPYKINCGTMIAKSTPWCKKFLDELWAMRDMPKYNQWAFEQEALHDLIEADAHGAVSRNKVKVHPVDAFNSDVHELIHHKNGARDAFVMHFMAQDSPTRQRELKAVCDREGV